MRYILLFLLFMSLFFISCNNNIEEASTQLSKVCYKEHCFEVELPKTDEEFRQGLMHRDHLDEDRGMLFAYPKQDAYYFWMKNTLIPLDIIWINEDKEVVYISDYTPPCEKDPCPSYGPDIESMYVLEVNAGVSQKIGLKEGELVEMYLQ